MGNTNISKNTVQLGSIPKVFVMAVKKREKVLR